MSKPIIEVHHLQKSYRLGEINARTFVEEVSRFFSKKTTARPSLFHALEDVSFTVMPGEILGVVGANGAGKSTLLKILSRITTPSAGEIIVRGKISSLLEVGTGMHPDLTGRENIYLNGSILGMTKKEIDAKLDEIIEFSEIREHIDTPVKHYSSGMNVRLGFAVAAHLEPDILIIDEVLAVGDINFQKKCLAKVKSISESGLTVLFVSHNMALISSICTRCLLLEKGKVVLDDLPAKAVDTYLYRTNTHIDSLAALTADKGVQLLAVTAKNTDGSKNIYSGAEVVFSISFSIIEADFKDLSFALTCHNASLQPIFRLNTKFSRNDVQIKKSGTLSVLIPELAIAEGKYHFSIFCRDNFGNQMVKEFFQLDNVLEIEVYDKGFLRENIVQVASTEGTLLLRQDWQFTEEIPAL